MPHFYPRFSFLAFRALLVGPTIAGLALSCVGIDQQAPEAIDVERVESALIAGWSSQDVGAVAAAGSWTESSGTHTLKASGADIYGAADEFRFVHQPILGDVTITARVASLTATDAWTKAGLMVREDLSAGARNAMVLATPTAANAYKLQSRSTPAGSTTGIAGAAGTPPVWLKLQRVGSLFRGYHSSDGATWTQIGSTGVTVSMNAKVYVGLALTSHRDGTVATATFSSVSITGAEPFSDYFEAEGGALTSPMQIAPDGSACGGSYVQVAGESNSTGSVPASGHVTWRFSVGTAGRHRFWGRVIAPTTSDDSFWVRVDNAAWILWNGIPPGSTWHWAPVHDSNAGAAVVQVDLTAGTHSLEIAYREDGAKLDRWFVTNDLGATPSAQSRPSARSIAPVEGAIGVRTTDFVSVDLILPNVGGGVDINTMNDRSVRLVRFSDGVPVAATRNTSGGADVIVLQPSAPLLANTKYAFSVTEELKDLTGAAFLPFSSTFTTGTAAPPPGSTAAFDKIALTTASGRDFSSLTIGPDGKLYAGTLTGEIVRFPLAADGVTGTAEVLNTLVTSNGGARAIVGLAFDPASTSSNLILWVTHGPAAFTNAPDGSGKLTKLTGATLATVKDVLVELPRSIKDHLTNSIAFKPGEPGVLYISQGSMSAMGAPDNAWGQRAEHVLSGAILRLDTARLPATLPLSVKTNDPDPTASGYNPFAANAPLTIFATGVRNAYDLVWHTNGSLYTPTNGSAAGGATPASLAPLPSACSRRIDNATRGAYTGPAVSAIASVSAAQSDFLFRVEAGGYYGHPNPARCEWVMNGGNPTSSADAREVAQYPVGTTPDRNYRGAAYDFGAHFSPNGVVEWKSDIGAGLKGKLLVARYSGGDDIIALTIDPTSKNVSAAQTGITGLTGLSDPLDLVENAGKGHLYVSELAAKRITLLRAR